MQAAFDRRNEPFPPPFIEITGIRHARVKTDERSKRGVTNVIPPNGSLRYRIDVPGASAAGPVSAPDGIEHPMPAGAACHCRATAAGIGNLPRFWRGWTTGGAHPRTAPERNKTGARLCAKHQPQHVEKLCGIRPIPAGHSCEAAAAGPAQRDSAALRGQCLGRVAQMERSAGLRPAAARNAERAQEIPWVFGLLNVLRLTEPRSASPKSIWATRPADAPGPCRRDGGAPKVSAVALQRNIVTFREDFFMRKPGNQEPSERIPGFLASLWS